MAIESLPTEMIEVPNENRRKPKTMVPITDAMRPIALALIAKGGQTYEEMSHTLKTKYMVVLAPEDVERLANANRNVLAELRKEIKKAAVADAKKMLKKVDTILDKKLNRTLGDMDKLEQLDSLYAQGLIEPDAYNQATAKLDIMPLTEVIKIAEHLQPKPLPIKGAAVALPPNSGDQQIPQQQESMSELADSLAQAIKNGDAVELQRIMYKGKQPDDTNA